MSIATAISALQSASANIATAISNKGVTVPSGSGLGDYATLIGQISGGGGGSSQVGTASASGTQTVTQTFTGLLGEPIAFAIESGSFNDSDGTYLNLTSNRIPISLICDGTTIYSISGYKSGSTARIYLYHSCTFSYSNGTLTITSPDASTVGTFRSGTYKMIYVY